jgi:hypothetical protein
MQRNAGIEEDLVLHLHSSGDRPAKAGDQFKQRSFPCAGRTKNARDRTIEGGVDLQRKALVPNLKSVR